MYQETLRIYTNKETTWTVEALAHQKKKIQIWSIVALRCSISGLFTKSMKSSVGKGFLQDIGDLYYIVLPVGHRWLIAQVSATRLASFQSAQKQMMFAAIILKLMLFIRSLGMNGSTEDVSFCVLQDSWSLEKKRNKKNSSFNIIVYSFVLGVWDSVPPLPKDFCYYRNKQIVEYIHHFQQQLLLKISLQLSLQPTTESWKVNYIH